MDKKKKKRKLDFTLMFVPHSMEQVYSYKLPDKALKAIIVVFAMFVLLIFYIIGYFVFMRHDVAELNGLRQQNEIQKKKVDTLQKQTNEMLDKMKDIDNLDKQIKDLTGIESTASNRNVSRSEIKRSGSFFGNSIENDMGDLDKDLNQLSERVSEKEKVLPEIKGKIIEKKAFVAAQPTLFPTQGKVTSPFGYRKSPFGRRSEFHNGVDIAAPYGTDVFASADGVVVVAGWSSGYGREVIIDHGFGIKTAYAHNSSIMVRVGQQVKKGDLISKVGSSGWSTGPHLHFMVLINDNAVDPMRFLQR